MGKILIRTNGNSRIGLGHLFRMKNLASSFPRKKIIFILDYKSKIVKKILKEKCIFLYNRNEKFKSQKDDANKVKEIIKNIRTDLIIIDDYRFDINWENFFFGSIKLAVFDDNNKKKHKCNFLIDSKWVGNSTYERYKYLVNKEAIKLLGPKYAIIKKDFRNKHINKKCFNLLFYIGGGGDFKKYKKFLIGIASRFQRFKKIKLIIIKGPYSKNNFYLNSELKKFSNIEIVEENLNINNILNKIDLYLGVASSIIYELNNKNIPSILFSVNKNQENSIVSFNDLGFPFLISQKDIFNQSRKVIILIEYFIKNISRIKKLNKNKLAIDKKGANRISNILIDYKKLKDNKLNQPIYYSKNSFKKKNGCYKVTDDLINNYLLSRNIFSNRKNSINSNLIKNIDHYLWWFKEPKKLYYLLRDNKIRLYFYHKIINIKLMKYYYGGWFVTNNKIIISDIINVINWQIKKFKKYRWLAIIQKKNYFVNKINLYLGFSKVPFLKKHRNFFSKLKVNKFNLLIK